jgi:hypothetical protein
MACPGFSSLQTSHSSLFCRHIWAFSICLLSLFNLWRHPCYRKRAYKVGSRWHTRYVQCCCRVKQRSFYGVRCACRGLLDASLSSFWFYIARSIFASEHCSRLRYLCLACLNIAACVLGYGCWWAYASSWESLLPSFWHALQSHSLLV